MGLCHLVSRSRLLGLKVPEPGSPFTCMSLESLDDMAPEPYLKGNQGPNASPLLG